MRVKEATAMNSNNTAATTQTIECSKKNIKTALRNARPYLT